MWEVLVAFVLGVFCGMGVDGIQYWKKQRRINRSVKQFEKMTTDFSKAMSNLYEMRASRNKKDSRTTFFVPGDGTDA